MVGFCVAVFEVTVKLKSPGRESPDNPSGEYRVGLEMIGLNSEDLKQHLSKYIGKAFGSLVTHPEDKYLVDYSKYVIDSFFIQNLKSELILTSLCFDALAMALHRRMVELTCPPEVEDPDLRDI